MGLKRVQKTTFFKGLGTNKIYVRKDSRVVPVMNTFRGAYISTNTWLSSIFFDETVEWYEYKKGAKHHNDNSFFVTVALM